MNKQSMWVVVFGASCIFFQLSASQPLYDTSDRQAIDAWVNTYYKPLTPLGKKILISSGHANLEMFQACKKALAEHEGGVKYLTKEAFERLLKLWTHGGELIKEQAAVEVIDVVCAINALNQLRLNWLKKVVLQYQQNQPGLFERIIVRFSQKGKFKLYRELNTLVKWSREIVDQFIFFENELLASL